MGVESELCEHQTKGREEMANKFGSRVLRTLSLLIAGLLSLRLPLALGETETVTLRERPSLLPSLFPWAGVDGWQREGRERRAGKARRAGAAQTTHLGGSKNREGADHRRASFLALSASASEAGGGGRKGVLSSRPGGKG